MSIDMEELERLATLKAEDILKTQKMEALTLSIIEVTKQLPDSMTELRRAIEFVDKEMNERSKALKEKVSFFEVTLDKMENSLSKINEFIKNDMSHEDVIKTMSGAITDRNNKNSLIISIEDMNDESLKVLNDKFQAQSKKMFLIEDKVDKLNDMINDSDNDKSLITRLSKQLKKILKEVDSKNNVKNSITWVLLSIVAILTSLDKLGIIGG